MNLGIEPPKGVLLFGPPGTGKTLCARAVANRTDACFTRDIGSELVQKYVGEVRNGRGRVSCPLCRGLRHASKNDIVGIVDVSTWVLAVMEALYYGCR